MAGTEILPPENVPTALRGVQHVSAQLITNEISEMRTITTSPRQFKLQLAFLTPDRPDTTKSPMQPAAAVQIVTNIVQFEMGLIGMIIVQHALQELSCNQMASLVSWDAQRSTIQTLLLSLVFLAILHARPVGIILILRVMVEILAISNNYPQIQIRVCQLVTTMVTMQKQPLWSVQDATDGVLLETDLQMKSVQPAPQDII